MKTNQPDQIKSKRVKPVIIHTGPKAAADFQLSRGKRHSPWPSPAQAMPRRNPQTRPSAPVHPTHCFQYKPPSTHS